MYLSLCISFNATEIRPGQIFLTNLLEDFFLIIYINYYKVNKIVFFFRSTFPKTLVVKAPKKVHPSKPKVTTPPIGVLRCKLSLGCTLS